MFITDSLKRTIVFPYTSGHIAGVGFLPGSLFTQDSIYIQVCNEYQTTGVDKQYVLTLGYVLEIFSGIALYYGDTYILCTTHHMRICIIKSCEKHVSVLQVTREIHYIMYCNSSALQQVGSKSMRFLGRD